MAEDWLRDRGFAGGVCAGRECRNSLLFPTEFGILSKNLAQTFFTGAEPAAPDQECGELDAVGGSHHRSGSADDLSAHGSGWVSHAQHSSRKEPIQPASAVLLTFPARKN
jgi:hypothetical protein